MRKRRRRAGKKASSRKEKIGNRHGIVWRTKNEGVYVGGSGDDYRRGADLRDTGGEPWDNPLGSPAGLRPKASL